MIFSFGRWMLADWQLKLAGLGIALVLYIYVHSEERLSLMLRVPLELRNPPQAMKFASTPPTAVEVRLEAERAAISAIVPGSVRAIVDLAEVKGLSANITLGPEHIKRPPGVSVLSVSPSQLVLLFAPVGKKKR